MSVSSHDLADAQWRKSSYSGGGAAQCVELAYVDAGTAVRDSKQPAAGFLTFTPESFTIFMAAAKSGRLDRN
ncbi:DUF397 domain-containing protein [Goodfellowiella coeruleoviolacea]|uniref:DUF397 domain-containing protein n=1 Tax=Goodfellowiella coeruleoviolacea TaxID=334858 RepID=A0AAE3KK46_9PSEU|nr:DUF397 domain-containing protein [Goodfellowiella coeruleoviolacea]MCP2169792.1 protein of unknown function (DUF397) [Goodfellowiella coeruleoviolacea]